MDFFVHICINIFLLAECSTSEKKILNPKLSKHPKLVILSYDGFRFDFREKTDTPTLDRLKAEGVHSAYMKAQFTTKTFPNHQSIVTGLHTQSHGIMDNKVYDPERGGLLSGYESYNEKFWNFRPDVAPVWVYNQLAGDGRYSGASWPGSNQPYGKDGILPTHYFTYNKSLSFEDRVEFILKWLTDEDKPSNLVFMYFDEPDGMGHSFGPESPEVVKEIQRMDKVTQYLLKRLKEEEIYDQVNIIIVSDHGLQEVSLRYMVNITALIDLKSIYYPYVGTPITQFRPKPGKLEEVYQGLKEGSKTLNFSVYKKEELPKEWNYGDNRRIMPIVVIANVGYVFDDFVNRAKAKERRNIPDGLDLDAKYGSHGYDNNAPSMRAFFLAHGPIFKKGVEIPPFENIDLFSLVCKIMNFEPPPNNGTLSIIAGALLPSSSSPGSGSTVPGSGSAAPGSDSTVPGSVSTAPSRDQTAAVSSNTTADSERLLFQKYFYYYLKSLRMDCGLPIYRIPWLRCQTPLYPLYLPHWGLDFDDYTYRAKEY